MIVGREPDDTETATALEMLASAEIHNVPVWLDISHYGKFTDMAKYSAALLVKHGSSLDLSKLGEVCVSLEHLWDGKDAVGLVHGDLKRDNILVCSDGIKIIDWQRPMFAPKIIDGVSALTVTDADAVRLAKLIEAYWLLYAFDKKLGALGHVFKWAEKDIADVI